MNLVSSLGGVYVLITSVVFAHATDIRLIQDSDNPSSNIGSLELKLGGRWHSVCRQQWGANEARVACKQLGFQGGWKYTIPGNMKPTVSQFLERVKCDGFEAILQDCSYNLTSSCENDRLAGVQCFDSFEARLVGGNAPNVGRVEVRHDDVWSNVCYEGEAGDRDWSFYNVQVLCRELGFPGAMFKKRGGQGNGNRQYVINDYLCGYDLNYNSISECHHDIPMAVQDNSYPSCKEKNEAVASCAVPGYIGCYEEGSDWELLSRANILKLIDTMTIRACRYFCSSLGSNIRFHYAALSGGNTCFCSDQIFTNQAKSGDRACKLKCSGNELDACGSGDGDLSVYDVTYGFCEDPENKSSIYFYGDIYNVTDVPQCDAGQELVGGPVIQCVLGDYPNATQWNDSLPYCRDSPSSFSRHNGLEEGAVIGIVCGSLLFMALVALTIGFILLRRHRMRQTVDQGHWGKAEESDTRKPEIDKSAIVVIGNGGGDETGEIPGATAGKNSGQRLDNDSVSTVEPRKSEPRSVATIDTNNTYSDIPSMANQAGVSDKDNLRMGDNTPETMNKSGYEYAYIDKHNLSNSGSSGEDNADYSYAYAEVKKKNKPQKSGVVDKGWEDDVAYHDSSAAYADINVKNDVSIESPRIPTDSNQHVPNSSDNAGYSYAYAEVKKKNNSQKSDVVDEGWEDNVAYHDSSADLGSEATADVNEGEGWVENNMYNVAKQ